VANRSSLSSYAKNAFSAPQTARDFKKKIPPLTPYMYIRSDTTFKGFLDTAPRLCYFEGWKVYRSALLPAGRAPSPVRRQEMKPMNAIRPKNVEFVKTSAEKVPFAAKNGSVSYPTTGHPTEKNVEFFKESAQKKEPFPSLVRESRRYQFAPEYAPIPAKSPLRSRREPRKTPFRRRLVLGTIRRSAKSPKKRGLSPIAHCPTQLANRQIVPRSRNPHDLREPYSRPE
jgi:hypothetical protein